MAPAGRTHDLIVLGGGVGAAAAALAGAAAGLRTLCVWPPSRQGDPVTARGLDTVLLAGVAEVAWSGLRPCTNVLADEMRAAGIDLIRAAGRLDGPGRVRLPDGAERSAPAIILAAGSRPAGLPGAPVDGRFIVAPSAAAGWPDSAPDPVLVAGAGPEGAAIAGVLAARGRDVVLAEVGPRILPGFAPTMADDVWARLGELGVDVRCRTRVRGVRTGVDGVLAVLAGLDTGDRQTWRGPRLVAATGWRPATSDLGLDTVAAVQDKRGHVQVDSGMQTAEPGLYALGDLVPTASWPGVAAVEAAVAVAHITGGTPPPVRSVRLAAIAPTDPPLIAVGLDAAAARTAGHLVRTVEDRADGLRILSVIDDEDDRILGCHMAGDEAGKLARRLAELVDDPAAAIAETLPAAELAAGLLWEAAGTPRPGESAP